MTLKVPAFGELGRTVVGLQYTRLIRGHVVHLLAGRFGVYAGFWGLR